MTKTLGASRLRIKTKENMNNKFDELTKSMAQSVTRRAALKKFGLGLAGMALACFGLENKAEAGSQACLDACKSTCSKYAGTAYYTACMGRCIFTRCQWG